jgi:hypothetical protein
MADTNTKLWNANVVRVAALILAVGGTAAAVGRFGGEQVSRAEFNWQRERCVVASEASARLHERIDGLRDAMRSEFSGLRVEIEMSQRALVAELRLVGPVTN